MNEERQPIGVFDSGVGGLTVVRALRAELPGEDVVYLGDTARVPYGSKSPRTIERYSIGCQRFLLDRGVKLVLVACNTASANAIPALTGVSEVPVIGAVEPGARSALAATQGGRIGVIGTLGTVRSGAYEAAIAALDAGVQVSALACPMLVPLAEEGWVDDEIAAAISRRYLAQLLAMDPQIDTLVLGCTHYPLLSEILSLAAEQLSGRRIAVVDSAAAMAAAARETLGEVGSNSPGQLRCYVTDASRLDELGPRFLGEDVSFELVDLS